MSNESTAKFNWNEYKGLLIYFIPYTKEPSKDIISTRIPLLYSVLRECAEVRRAPQSLHAKNFLLDRILLLITSTKLYFKTLKDRERIIIFGSDQPAGFTATVLGTITKFFWKSRCIRIIYDSHGSRYKLALDLNPPLIYRVISIFEDSLSVKVADLIIVPTYADKVTYAQYTRRKDKFIVLPSLVRTDNIVPMNGVRENSTLLFTLTLTIPPI